ALGRARRRTSGPHATLPLSETPVRSWATACRRSTPAPATAATPGSATVRERARTARASSPSARSTSSIRRSACCSPRRFQEKYADPARIYLNRLSDLLFVLARVLNREGGRGDVLWQQGKNR